MAKKERKNIIHLSKSHFRRRRFYRTISCLFFFDKLRFLAQKAVFFKGF